MSHQWNPFQIIKDHYIVVNSIPYKWIPLYTCIIIPLNMIAFHLIQVNTIQYTWISFSAGDDHSILFTKSHNTPVNPMHAFHLLIFFQCMWIHTGEIGCILWISHQWSHSIFFAKSHNTPVNAMNDSIQINSLQFKQIFSIHLNETILLCAFHSI